MKPTPWEAAELARVNLKESQDRSNYARMCRERADHPKTTRSIRPDYVKKAIQKEREARLCAERAAKWKAEAGTYPWPHTSAFNWPQLKPLDINPQPH